MTHSAKAVILRCIDFRFVADTAAFLKSLGFAGSYDDVAIAGAVKNLVDPYDPTDTEFAYRQLALARKLHGVTDVVLLNHTDCGAYGGRATFASDEEEHARHVKDLSRAKEMVEHRFPDDHLTVHCVLARWHEDGTIDFEKVS